MYITLSYFLQGNESEMAIRYAKFCNLKHHTSSYSKTQCHDPSFKSSCTYITQLFPYYRLCVTSMLCVGVPCTGALG